MASVAKFSKSALQSHLAIQENHERKYLPKNYQAPKPKTTEKKTTPKESKSVAKKSTPKSQPSKSPSTKKQPTAPNRPKPPIRKNWRTSSEDGSEDLWVPKPSTNQEVETKVLAKFDAGEGFTTALISTKDKSGKTLIKPLKPPKPSNSSSSSEKKVKTKTPTTKSPKTSKSSTTSKSKSLPKSEKPPKNESKKNSESTAKPSKPAVPEKSVLARKMEQSWKKNRIPSGLESRPEAPKHVNPATLKRANVFGGDVDQEEESRPWMAPREPDQLTETFQLRRRERELQERLENEKLERQREKELLLERKRERELLAKKRDASPQKSQQQSRNNKSQVGAIQSRGNSLGKSSSQPFSSGGLKKRVGDLQSQKPPSRGIDSNRMKSSSKSLSPAFSRSSQALGKRSSLPSGSKLAPPAKRSMESHRSRRDLRYEDEEEDDYDSDDGFIDYGDRPRHRKHPVPHFPRRRDYDKYDESDCSDMEASQFEIDMEEENSRYWAEQEDREELEKEMMSSKKKKRK